MVGFLFRIFLRPMKKNILLWGLLEDGTMKSVYDHLLQMKAPVFFLNHAKIAHSKIFFNSNPSLHYRLRYDDKEYDLEEFPASYLRPYNFRDYLEFQNTTNNDEITREANLFHHALTSWAEATAGVTINKPSAETTNHSKLYQNIFIRNAGFEVPRSLVTNDIEELKAFHAEHTNLIYKSISSVRSIVKKFSLPDLEKVKNGMGLVFFQQHIDGENIRIHVVGSEIFGAKIISDAEDYRYSPSQITEVKIPSAIKDNCIRLAKDLGLLVTGIDFIRTANDEWYCLEANPSPGFSFYEIHPEKPIARAVAALLAG